MFLMFSFALLTSFTAKSQAAFVGTATNPTRAILNATEDTALYQTTSSYSVVTIQVKVTKSSGTMAGKVYIWSSPDGASGSYTLRDSATLSNTTTQFANFDYTGQVRRNWMVIQKGATTVAGTLNAKMYGAGN